MSPRFGEGMKLQRVPSIPPAAVYVNGQHVYEGGAAIPPDDYGVEFWFWCKPCKTHHRFTTRLPKGGVGPVWAFNGNMRRPTFTPSLLYPDLGKDSQGRTKRCHLHLREGMIEYCDDCTHELAGKKVPLEGLP